MTGAERLARLTDSVGWNAMLATGCAGLPLAAFGAAALTALALRQGAPGASDALLLLLPLLLLVALWLGRRLYRPRGVMIPAGDPQLRRLGRGISFVLLYPLVVTLLILSALSVEPTVERALPVAGLVAVAALAPRLVSGLFDGALVVAVGAAILPFLGRFADPWMAGLLGGLAAALVAHGGASHALYVWEGRRRAAEVEEA